MKEPFYNEAGYEEYVGVAEGRQSSRIYSEQVYLTKLQHLMDMAAHTPSDWRYAFRRHYRFAVPHILRRANQYLHSSGSSTPPPADSGDVLINSDGLHLPFSRGFVMSLSQYVRLLQAQYDALLKEWDAEELRCRVEFDDDEDG